MQKIRYVLGMPFAILGLFLVYLGDFVSRGKFDGWVSKSLAAMSLACGNIAATIMGKNF